MIPESEDLRVVRYYPAVGLATLFRPLPKCNRGTLDVVYTPKTGGTSFRFSGKEGLGVPEQTLLLVVLEVGQDRFNADPEACILRSTARDVAGRALWTRLHRGLEASDTETVFFQTTWHELALRCGLTVGGTVQRMLQAQLCRLCEATVWEYETGSAVPTHQSFLVAWCQGNTKGVHLAVNFRLASVLFGERYAPVSLTERLSLNQDPSRAVHAFLSTTVRRGHSLNIGIGTLVGRLWPDRGENPPEGTDRRQRKAVLDVLCAVGRLPGWTVAMGSAGTAKVSRLQSGVRDMTSRRHVANESSSFHDVAKSQDANKVIGFGVADVSGRFSTRE